MNKEKLVNLRTRIVEFYRQRYEINWITISVTLGNVVLTALCYWFMNVMSNVASKRSPDNHVVAPLRDAGFEKIGQISALYLTDVFDAIAIIPAVLYLLLAHRTPMSCAVQALIACTIGCLMRITTVAITSFPDPRLDCERVTGSPFDSVSLHRCGDAMFSGHTMIFVLGALMWTTFSPLTLIFRAISLFFWCCAIAGGLIILANRSHYTVDVLVACYVTVGAWYFVQWWWHNWVVLPNRLTSLRFPHGNMYDSRGRKLVTNPVDNTGFMYSHTRDTSTSNSLPMAMQDLVSPPGIHGQSNFSMPSTSVGGNGAHIMPPRHDITAAGMV
ncbi:PAP2 superfamily C-terminal-domain-containing protein [Syncephalis fuscata]|nr:PAP2 superfamily C-terminal-domain-containing protein [Syncephalis fuscata]